MFCGFSIRSLSSKWSGIPLRRKSVWWKKSQCQWRRVCDIYITIGIERIYFAVVWRDSSDVSLYAGTLISSVNWFNGVRFSDRDGQTIFVLENDRKRSCCTASCGARQNWSEFPTCLGKKKRNMSGMAELHSTQWGHNCIFCQLGKYLQCCKATCLKTLPQFGQFRYAKYLHAMAMYFSCSLLEARYRNAGAFTFFKTTWTGISY